MYPHADLIQLSARKKALRLVIGRQRVLAMRDLAVVLQPVGWLDRANAVRRRLAPYWSLASLPFLWWFGRPRSGAVTVGWRRWVANAPWLMRAVRIAMSWRGRA